MRILNDLDEFQEILKAPRAMVLLHTRWSEHSVRAFNRFAEFAGDAEGTAWVFGVQLSFWVIDISDQSSVLAKRVHDWIESNRIDATLMMSGGGPLIWSENGVVIKVASSLNWVASLLNSTRFAYQAGDS